jgi:DNA repair ATPase RecN
MNYERQRENLSEIMQKIQELEQKINATNRYLEEIEEDLTYTVELIRNYQRKVEESSRFDTILVNILLFTVGLLLGFALAILFFK